VLRGVNGPESALTDDAVDSISTVDERSDEGAFIHGRDRA
jgi:hypothetical protein